MRSRAVVISILALVLGGCAIMTQAHFNRLIQDLHRQADQNAQLRGENRCLRRQQAFSGVVILELPDASAPFATGSQDAALHPLRGVWVPKGGIP